MPPRRLLLASGGVTRTALLALLGLLVTPDAAAQIPGLSLDAESRAQSELEGLPGTFGDLVVWLKADGDVERDFANLVTLWGDESLNGMDLEQDDLSQAPHYRPYGMAGRPALHFDGNDFLFRLEGMPVNADYTKVVVFSAEDLSKPNGLVSGHAQHALWLDSTSTPKLNHQDINFVDSPAPVMAGTPTILMAAYDDSEELGAIYQDGVFVASGSGPPNGKKTLQIGSYASDNFLRGSIAEVMIFDKVLDQDQRQKVYQYLDHKYRGGPAWPEFEFDKFPKDGTLLPRNVQNQALVEVEGRILTPGYTSLEVDLFRDEELWDSITVPLVYVDGEAPFLTQHTIEAGLCDHHVLVSLRKGAEVTRIAEAINVVAGDVMLIMGQSNAVAGDHHFEEIANDSISHWVRSFGTTAKNVPEAAALDQHWALAEGIDVFGHGSVGAWGLRLGDILYQNHGIPIAIMNGARGNSSITDHLPNFQDPLDLSTVYGRFLFRNRQAEVNDLARAMIWYQGESDGLESAQFYLDNFDLLRAAWMFDYPSASKIYVVQLREGCGLVNKTIREVQRTLPELYPNVSVMATASIPTHDGCHFYTAGYQALAERLERVMTRDLYQVPSSPNVDAPNITRADYVNPSHMQVELTFNPPGATLVLDPGATAYFELNDGTPILSGQVEGNKLTLQLDGQSNATSLSYLGHELDGPWLSNALGVGALTFFDFSITP